MVPIPTNTFTTLTGVPVHYARPPLAPYGTRGILPKHWRATPEFQAKAEAAFTELWTVCPLGKANLIVSAGFFVDKPGLHGLGRAMDLDSLWWDTRTWVALNYPHDTAFYLAVEAVFKKHFGVVLNYLYNPSHHDHLHINDTDEPGFSPSARSEVLFAQAALTHVFKRPVHITGEWTREAQLAVHDLFGGTMDLRMKVNWLAFLRRTAREGFGVPVVPKTPLDLLHDLYTIIGDQLEGDERRKRVEAAVNAFATHEDTQGWLNQYR